jgi:hypothetical protein
MKREEKCKYLIEKGYTYNPQTGEVKNPHGKILKNKNGLGYLRINQPKLTLFQHQFAWYYIYGECVKTLDHINGIKDDNRICNLRSITQQQNTFNKKNVKGYTWDSRVKKWQSKIKLNYKQIHLGYFNNEDDARQSYINAKEKYHII